MTARPIIGSDIGMPARVTLRREFLVHSHRQVSQAPFNSPCLQQWTYMFSQSHSNHVTCQIAS